MNEDSSRKRTSTIKSLNACQPQLAQSTPHAVRLVFDPGGSRSVVVLHKDVHDCKPKSRRNLTTTYNIAVVACVQGSNSIIFTAETR